MSTLSTTVFHELDSVYDTLAEQSDALQRTNATVWNLFYYFRHVSENLAAVFNSLNNGFQFFVEDYARISDLVLHTHYTIGRYETAYGDWLGSMDSLSDGRLSHTVLDPQTLANLLNDLQAQLDEQLEPIWCIAQPNVNHYYSVPLVQFTNTPTHLVLQIPVFLKLKELHVKSLFSIQTVPVPFNAETYDGIDFTFTHVNIKDEYIAFSPTNYVLITESELRRCTLLRDIYYCEGNFLTRSYDEPSCPTSIFLDKLLKRLLLYVMLTC